MSEEIQFNENGMLKIKDLEHLQELLHKRCLNLNYKQSELADKVNSSQPTVSRVFKRERSACHRRDQRPRSSDRLSLGF